MLKVLKSLRLGTDIDMLKVLKSLSWDRRARDLGRHAAGINMPKVLTSFRWD